MILRLGLATLFGLLLGIDREVKHKPLGLRAFTLISLGSAGFTLIATQVIDGAAGSDIVGIDPTRVIQGIVSGIGFVGAGAIIQSQQSIKGTATGAGIWVAGAIGIACGFGFLTLAAAITGFAFITLTVLELLTKKLGDRNLESPDESTNRFTGDNDA